jgi:GTP-binding protein
MKLPIVAIIGRPNVGKSSLFNRFLGHNLAVVDETSGVTRDRNYADCEWRGVKFRIVDTGGIIEKDGDEMQQHIFDQAMFAVNEADLVLFLVDSRIGPSDVDVNIARRLRKIFDKTILVANKADSDKIEIDIYEFMKLGMGEPFPVSATAGRNVGDLLDVIVSKLPVQDASKRADKSIRVAVVGRPNVGKSSFINKLIGQERLIVTPIAGTTRDAVDTVIEFENRQFTLVDTAGLRKRYKVHEDIEFYSNLRAARAIENCDVAIVVIDAFEGVTTQDQKILEQVLKNRRSAVLAVNKWDLIEKDEKTTDKFSKAIKKVLARLSFLPVIYTSALTGQRLAKVLQLVSQVFNESLRRISTSDLNAFLQKAVSRRHPPAKESKHIKLNYMTQTDISPPSFLIFCNHPKLIDRSYANYLENQVREEFGFSGVPIRIKFRRK